MYCYLSLLTFRVVKGLNEIMYLKLLDRAQHRVVAQ